MAILTLGVAPTKRGFLSMEEAKRQKDKFMAVIRTILPEAVAIVDADDVAENGILFTLDQAAAAVEKFKAAKIDALFVPFCDFGEEQVAAAVAAGVQPIGGGKLPVLVWGNRDERPNNAQGRGRDTQCGMFASTKVMARYGVTYSYIFNCETESDEFRTGFETFLRAAAVVKSIKGLRIAKIGARPGSFMSVMANEAQYIRDFGIVTVPISPNAVAKRAAKIVEENGEAFQSYLADVTGRIDFSSLSEEAAKKQAATVLAIQDLMQQNGCTVGALECWSAGQVYGLAPCLAVGELADRGTPLACETDINGAITLAMLRGVTLGEESAFFADLTIRHPANDNAELLWHCGPFPYSLKDPDCPACMTGTYEHWFLKKGDITILRFDELDGKYYVFSGEGRATDGPETTGTYVWFEVDNWKKWEQRLMFGPYIHHVGGVYGKYARAIEEAVRYLPNAVFDHPDADGPRCL